MKTIRKRILPKVWLSAIAIGALFLGFAGATVKASDNQTGGYFGLTSVGEYLYETFTGIALVETIQFQPGSYTVNEPSNAGGLATTTVRITVTRSGQSAGNVSPTTVQYSTANGTPTATGGAACGAGVDYISQTGTLTFDTNVTQQTFDITVCSDGVFEGSEVFNVVLSNPTNPNDTVVLGSPATATVTINDADVASPGTFGFDVNNSQTVNVAENVAGGTLALNVTRSAGSAGTATVNFTINNGSAVGGAACNGTGSVDFVFPNGVNGGTLTFVAGDTLEQIVIQICDDPVSENNESFTVTLNSASAGTIDPARNTSTVTIVDNETPTPGVIQFSQTAYSANEGVGPAGGATVANNATTTIQLAVVRSGGTTGAASAQFTLMNGTAIGGTTCTGGADFIDPNPNPSGTADGVVNFPNGNGQTSPQTAFISVQICNNDGNADAFSETFTVMLSNATGGATIGANQTATVTIFDDATGTVQFNPTTYTPAEGTSSSTAGNGTTPATTTVPLTLTRSAGTQVATSQVVVNYAFTDSGAVGGPQCLANGMVDYINTGGVVTFDPNVTQATLNVFVCADAIFEANESFIVTLTQNSANSVIVFPTQPGTMAPNPSQALVTITNDDTAQGGQISLANTAFAQSNELTVSEAVGTVPIQVIRTFSDEVASVTINVTSGTGTNGAQGGASCATAGVDFITPAATTVTFAQGQTTLTAPITITICDDAVFENNEFFNVTISGATSASGTAAVNQGFATRVITIVDNDAQPGTLNISPLNTQFGVINESNGTGAASFVQLITVSRPAGQTNGTVTATFTVSASGPAPVATGGAACGDATTDFVTSTGTVTIPDGQSSATIPVTICNNDANDTSPNEELRENFTVTLSNATGGATLGVNSTTVFTIQDDARGTFQISAPTPVSEGSGTLQITVNRVGGTTSNGGPVTVNYTLGGTAVGATGDCTQGNGLDYTFLAGNNTLSFGQGVTSATINLTLCDDALIEGNETIVVTLTQTPAAAGASANTELFGTTSPFTITITDNEAAQTFTVTAPQAVASNEGQTGQTPFTFTVTPSAANQTATSGTFTVVGSGTNPATGGTACGGNVDFITPVAGSNTVNFAANSTAAQQITVQVCGDTINEQNETFTVTFTPTGSTTGTSAIGTIINDDAANGTISSADNNFRDLRIVEDGTVPGANANNPAPATGTGTITITLQNPTVNAASVQFATAGGTATGGTACTAGVDYITTSGTVNFASNSGTPTTPVTITVCNDSIKEANETIFVNLTNGSNATINDAQAVVIIVDNDRAFRADFDRDRRTDVSLFRPSNGFFYILQSINGLFMAEQFGTAPGSAGDIPVPGDYDNDGAADLAYFRPSNGTFVIRQSSSNAVITVQFGQAGDIPVQGDYNGDGQTDVAVFRPSSGTFFISNTLTNPSQSFTAVQFGQAGDIPVPADYDGDFRTDVAVFRPSIGTFFAMRSRLGAIGFQFGQNGDRPVVGDFDGDGSSDFTVFRPSGTPNVTGGVFFTFQSLTNTPAGVAFGSATDIPAIGDYDGDGTDDVAIYRDVPSAGFGASFFILRSQTGSSVNVTPGTNGATRFGNADFTRAEFGVAGDIPLPARYQPAVQQ